MSFGLPLTPARRVFAGFALYAFAMGNIFPRIGDIQTQMGVTTGALGLGLIGAPIGTLIALTFSTPFLERFGFRRAYLTLVPLLALFYALAVRAPDPTTLFFMLIPVGLTIGCIEIIINTEADRTEYQLGYRIMNRSHAFWSIGFFSAGLFGAAMAWLGLTPQQHLLLVVPLICLGMVLCMADFQPAPPRPGNSAVAASVFTAPTLAILVLVAITIPAMLLEGASMDWSAIYMRDSFDAGPFLRGLAVAVFAIAQATARFFADGFVDRHSPAAVARATFTSLLIGTLIVCLSPSPALSLLGFALMGLGASTIFPLAMSAAAQMQDRSAADNVAALAQFSFTIFLIGPPLLGHVAQSYGMRVTFGIGLPFILLSLAMARHFGQSVRN